MALNLLAALVAAAFATADAPPSTASAQPSIESSDSPTVASVTKLVETVNPDDRMLAQEMRGWEAGMRQRLAADISVAKLEQEYPGITNAAVAAARPVAEKYVTGMLLKLKRHKIESTARTLTSAEVAEVDAFFRSPAGVKLSEGLMKPEQADHLAKRISAKGEDDRTITQKDANAALGDAVKSVMAEASSEDVLAIMRFEASPAGRKLRTLGDEGQRYALEVINEPSPAFIERQDKALADAIIAFAERSANK